MLEKDNAAGYGSTSVMLSWLVAITFIVTFVISVSWPLMNVGDPERDFRRALHMTLGVFAFVAIVLRLIWWFMNEKPSAPGAMTENAYGLSRLVLLCLYLDILGLCISGFMNSWSMAYEVSMFGLFTLPILNGFTVAMSGYAHSVFLFFNNIMVLCFLVVNIYHALRYKVGFRRMLPGPQA